MIIRVQKRDRFTILSNSTIEDRDLSWEALGLLAFLLSKPNDWRICSRYLITVRKAGKDKVGRILRELGAAGYYVRRSVRTKTGRFEWENVIQERPNLLSPENPATAKPPPGNSPLSKTDLQSTVLSKTDQREGGAWRSEAAISALQTDISTNRTPWPDGFELDSEMRQYAIDHGVDPASEFDAWRDDCAAHGRKYVDWRAAWRGRIHRVPEFARHRPQAEPAMARAFSPKQARLVNEIIRDREQEARDEAGR